MAHAQKPDMVFHRNGRVHLNWWVWGEVGGGQFSRLLAAEVCASAVVMVVMLDTPCSEVECRRLATHSTRMFPLHFPYRASPCAIRFQLSFYQRYVEKEEIKVTNMRLKKSVTFWLCCHLFSVFTRTEMQHYNT